MLYRVRLFGISVVLQEVSQPFDTQGGEAAPNFEIPDPKHLPAIACSGEAGGRNRFKYSKFK
jgi:hypothetical protein